MSASASRARLTKAQLIAKADGICIAGVPDRHKLVQAINSAAGALQASDTPKTRTRLGGLIRQNVALIRSQLKQLRALRAPAADAVPVSRYLSSRQASLELLGQVGGRVFSDRLQDLNALDLQTKALKAKSAALARSYGFKVCSSSATT